MISPFEELLKELSRQIGLDLHPDQHGICCLKVDEDLRIQIEPDSQKGRLLIGSFIGELMPGRFREEVLKEALKANALILPEGKPGGMPGGTLAFHQHNNQLFLFHYVAQEGLDGPKLVQALAQFTNYAMLWHNSIKNGRPTPLNLGAPHPSPLPFGIRP